MDPALPPDYPQEWETHAVLADGAPVEVRPIRPADRDLLDAFHQRQSPTSIYYRYFQHKRRLRSAELDHLTTIDYRNRMAFVTLLHDQLVGVARYEPFPVGNRPEVAFFIDDEHHGRGLATLLLEYLAAAARARGVDGFVATVLPENHGMLRVFRRAGFGATTKFVDGLIEVELDISLTAESADAMDARASVARTRSVGRLLRPSSVAVVGAGRTPGSVGHELLRNLDAGGFAGPLHAVNRAADEVLGRPAHPTLAAIGEPVDLAVVAVPAAEVDAVVADAAEAGVGGLLVVAAGFSETGTEGVERERRLVDAARGNGMRVVGPNAFGMVNTAADVSMRALFLPLRPRAGSVAVASQSGPLGSAVLEQLGRSGVGISSFVALGNRADVSVNDLLDYWTHDDETDVVVLYVENFGNLRNFAPLIRAASGAKPVVALRPGDSGLAGLMAQSGVVMVDDVAQLSDVARMAAVQPLPAGGRVAIVANAASVARLAVAACRRHGLTPVSPASVRQPDGPPRVEGALLAADIDAIALAGGGSPRDHEELLVAASVSDDVDAVMVALVPNPGLDEDRLQSLVRRVDRSIAKPVVAVGLVGPESIAVEGVPTYSFPDEAARTLGHLADYACWRRDQAEPDGGPTDDPEPLDLVVPGRLLGGADEALVTLWTEGADELVDELDLPVPSWRPGETEDELVAAATDLGFPVVLKARGARRRGVGEAGGVAIDLHSADSLRRSHRRMAANPDLDLGLAAVQRMVPSVGNLRLELVQDPDSGAFVSVGLGGAASTGLGPVARRFVPLDARMVEELVDELSAHTDLDGSTRAVIVDVLTRLDRLARRGPELARITLDPFLMAGSASAAGDLQIVLRPWRRDPLSEVRRLGD